MINFRQYLPPLDEKLCTCKKIHVYKNVQILKDLYAQNIWDFFFTKYHFMPEIAYRICNLLAIQPPLNIVKK